MDNQHTYGQGQSDLFTEEPIIYAGVGERFLAVLIDGFILAIPNYLIGTGLSQDPESVAPNFLGALLGWLYFALQESSAAQATLGKRAMGIKVINQEGQRISFGQATGRYFGKIISTLILFIGYLMAFWDQKRQTLHDKMANTYVVKKP